MTDAAKPTTWDTRYDRQDYLFGTEPAEFVRQQASRLAPGSTALLVADGEGRNSVYLARRGVSVTAMDNSVRGIEKAKVLATAREAAVEFQLGDVDSWDWSAVAYDAVVAVFIQFAGPEMRDRIFAGLDAALKPGGLLLLHGFAPRQVAYGTGGPPHRENMYTVPMLRQAFAGYDVLHVADYDTTVDAGPGHNGKAALVDFVARKPA